MFFPVEDAVCKHQYPFSFHHGEGRIVGVFQTYADRFDIKISMFQWPKIHCGIVAWLLMGNSNVRSSQLYIPFGDQTWLAGKI